MIKYGQKNDRLLIAKLVKFGVEKEMQIDIWVLVFVLK